MALHGGLIPYAGTFLIFSDYMRPAIRLARRGFEVGEPYRDLVAFRADALRASPAAARVFLDDGEVPAPGFRLRQPDLADTLEALARHGRAGEPSPSVGGS